MRLYLKQSTPVATVPALSRACGRGRKGYTAQVLDQRQAQLNDYVRANVIKTAISILVLMTALGVCGVFYRAELLAVTQTLFRVLGPAGLLGILFVSDMVFSPIPPDAVLVVIANSELSVHWRWLILLIGALSATGGVLGFLLARHLSRLPRFERTFDSLRAKHEDSVRRFGGWAIAIGALTPVPFSVTCWTAGAMGVPLRRVAPITLLRIPRFYLFYWIIAFADSVSRAAL